MRFTIPAISEFSLSRQARDFKDAMPSKLVLPQSQDGQGSSFSSQEQSALLTHLPIEIRLLIWQYAIGDLKAHIISKYRRLGHIVINPSYWQNWNAPRPDLLSSSWIYTYGTLPSTKKLAEHNLCNLLVTCQQIHAEAVPVLYTTTTFTFFDLRTISLFKRSIPPQYWSAIRAVGIYAMLYRRDDINAAVEARSQLQLDAWQDACSTLSSMPNLRRLNIYLGNPRLLDAGYLAGGRKSDLCETVFGFLRGCRVCGQMDVSIAGTGEGEREKGWLNLLSLQEGDRHTLEDRLARAAIDCQIRYDLQEKVLAN